MPRTDAEYADVAKMIRDLRTHRVGTDEYRLRYDAIVARTLPLAQHTAMRFRGRGQPVEDLRQVACVGLLNAINRFEPDRGGEFLVFAVPTIMGEVRRYFRDAGWALKVPRRLKDLSLQLTKVREELTRQLGRAPTAREIATHLGVDHEDVVQATVAASHYSTISTDRSRASEGEGYALQDTLGEVDTRLDKVLDIETIRPLIKRLPSRERTVLHLRFFDDLTQSQIAEKLSCSQMQVSRILAKALNTLRRQTEAQMRDGARLRLASANAA